MKSFRFPLEAVLEARRAQETAARQHLAVTLEKQREAMARSTEALAALNQLLQAIATASLDRFSVAARERSWGLRQAQERICAERRVAVQECVRLVEEMRAQVVEARRNRELLENLQAARRAAWQKEAALAEQHTFDEFAMTRRHQAAQQNFALC